MKTLQRQNTKREIVKKVRFQKNEVAKGMGEKEKGSAAIIMTQTSNEEKQNGLAINVELQPVPANFESSLTNSNETEVTNKEEEGVKEHCKGAITLSLTE
jgi:transcriptional regulator of acetoin/glycerol metabolism